MYYEMSRWLETYKEVLLRLHIFPIITRLKDWRSQVIFEKETTWLFLNYHLLLTIISLS